MRTFKPEAMRISDPLLALINSKTDMIGNYFKMFVGKKTIQTFDDRETKNKALTRIIHLNDVVTEKEIQELKLLNERGAGIYMAINETDGTGRKEKNIVKVRSVFVDLDGAPLAPALQYDPTVVVESSEGRFHCYWFVDDMPLNAFGDMQKNIAMIFSGDNKVHDLPRVLRVPGFYHNKYEPFMSVIRGGVGTIFTYKKLVEMFPPEPKPLWSGKKYVLEKKTQDADIFRGKYGAPHHERNDHVMRRIGGCIKRGKDWNYIVGEAFKEGMACSPPLEEKEIELILKSARRYV